MPRCYIESVNQTRCNQGGHIVVGNRVLIVDEKEAILVVDEALVSKIDDQRGDMSRPEYLHALIDSQLQKNSEAQSQEDYITRQEFSQLTRKMGELMRSFLEFFLSCGLGLVPPSLDDCLQELEQQLKELTISQESASQEP